MKRFPGFVVSLGVMALLATARASAGSVRYVWPGSPAPGAGFLQWSNAAHTIQAALDAAVDGDTVVVTNGVYAAGGGPAAGAALTNRVCLTRAVTVRSVNGPSVTLLVGAEGAGGGNGEGAVRCAYVGTNAALIGFTLTNGHTRAAGGIREQCGGGVFCESSGVVSNCLVTGSSASSRGGGAAYGTLWHCELSGNAGDQGGGAFSATLYNALLTRNTATWDGGGAYNATLYNCTVAANTADSAGGLYGGTAENCVVYDNTVATANTNWTACTFAFSCTAPHPGGSSVAGPPLFADPGLGDWRLATGSPCTDSGTNRPWMGAAMDLAGAPRILAQRVDMGAYEYYGPPVVDITNGNWQVFGEVTHVAIGGTNNAYVVGSLTWTNDAGGGGSLAATASWSIAGIGLAFGPNTITVRGADPGGAWTSDTVVVVRSFVHGGDSPLHYASTNGADLWPYTNWATAARILHNAANVAAPGDTVWVSNGVYATGGGPYGMDQWTPSRVGVPVGVNVLSVNGPEVTCILGQPANGGGNGPEAVRCAYIGEGGLLAGFTLSNGHTKAITPYRWAGGAVTVGATLSNCVVTHCSSAQDGGGVVGGGLVVKCRITRCSALSGGAANSARLVDCLLDNNTAPSGGGAMASTLTDCVISNNTASSSAGGAAHSTLTRCVVEYNYATQAGGGTVGCAAYHCVIRHNSTGAAGLGGGCYGAPQRSCAIYRNYAGGGGGGAYQCGLYNCTVVANTTGGFGGGTAEGSAYSSLIAHNAGFGFVDVYRTALTRCRALRLRNGDSGMEAEPRLADYAHLSAESPCRGQGFLDFESVSTDLEGDAWASPPSIGCDEFHAASATGSLQVAVVADRTTVGAGFEVTLLADIRGHALGHRWDFGDGTQASNRLLTTHAWSAPGTYPVVLRAWNQTSPGGLAATALVSVAAQPVRYVNRANPTPAAPYTNWVTAATNIQNAVDACPVAGGLVWVTNGLYEAGRDAVIGGWRTRLILTNGVTVRSVNGPAFTSLAGVGPDGPDGIRCVYVGAKSKLIGFTLTNGVAHTQSAIPGGGAYCESEGVLSNCVVRNGFADSGAGVYGGTLLNCSVLMNQGGRGEGSGVAAAFLRDCAVWSNSMAWQGGGLASCEAENVTVWGNSSEGQRGGAYRCFFRNSVVWGNVCGSWPNADPVDCDFLYSCNDPLPGGAGNVSADPLFAAPGAGDFRLLEGSACIDSGTNEAWMLGSPDLGGAPRILNSRVDMGAFEYYGPPMVAITNAPGALFGENAAYTFRGTANAYVVGELAWAVAGPPAAGSQPVVSPWVIAAVPLAFGSNVFTVTGRNPGGATACATAVVTRLLEHGGVSPLHYASPSGASVWPYDTWAGAARSIQDALEAARAGETVLATNGLYAAGGAVVSGALSNRVALRKPLVLRSVNGPGATLLAGAAGAGGGNGDGAVRCAYVGSNAVLCGFTLTNGHTRAAGDAAREQRGGGAWCEDSGSVSNCILVGNSAAKRGGGGSGGAFFNCVLAGNSADGGGGAYLAALRHCTVADNAAASDGGGASGCTVQNSIAYHNAPDNLFGCAAAYTCSSPLPPGDGNTDAAPSFADRPGGNYRLAAGSAGLDAGAPAAATSADLDGVPRPLDGNADGTNAADMGAYEFASALADSDHDGLADAAELAARTHPLDPDTDGDAMEDGAETAAGTDPLDSRQYLGLLAPSNTVIQGTPASVVRWQSVAGKRYALERSTNLSHGAFGHTVQSNLSATAPLNTVTDTTATVTTPRYYRVRLE
jgi:hypothetical protein